MRQSTGTCGETKRGVALRGQNHGAWCADSRKAPGGVINWPVAMAEEARPASIGLQWEHSAGPQGWLVGS
jgi:hypothetical protein